MSQHFVAASVMRDALVRGDLDAFHDASAQLAKKSAEVPSPAWAEHLDAMNDAAVRAQQSDSIESAASALAAVGVACAQCHEDLGGPKVSAGTAPPSSGDVQSQMARHRWAVERMWDGLTAPSDDAWRKGSSAFADAPMVTDIPRDADAGTQVAALTLALRAHALGDAARWADSRQDRAKALAQVYETCAGCHEVLSVRTR